MSKYQADIAIAISGAQELTRVTNLVNKLNNSVNTVNRLASVSVGGNLKVANVENYNKALNTARRAMNNAAEGTKLQDNAITHYVTTLKNAEDAEIRLARAVKLRQKEMGMAPPPQVKPSGGKGGAGGGAGGRPGQRAESIALGVGFPLMFGAGPASIAGSLAGSFAGSGFGGQILGGALGAAIDKLGVAAIATAQSLSYPIEGFEKLREAGLFASRGQEYYISKLIETGRVAEATAVIQAEIIKKIGVRGVDDLTALDDSTVKLSKAWADFNIQLQAALAGPLAGLLGWLTGLVQTATVSTQATNVAIDLRRQGSNEAADALSTKVGSIQQKSMLRSKGFFVEGSLEQDTQDIKRLIEYYKQFVEIKPVNAKTDPKTIEDTLNKQIANEEKIRGLRKDTISMERAGLDLRVQFDDTSYNLRKKVIDMERQGIEFRRSIEDQIFSKRQDLAKTLIATERQRQQNTIDAFDLQIREASSGLDPIARSIVDAGAQYLKVRAEGEADLQKNEKELKLQLQSIDQQTSKFKIDVENKIYQMTVQREEFTREVTKAKVQAERAILDYAIQVEDYRLKMVQHRYNLEVSLQKKQQIAEQGGLTSSGGGVGGRYMQGGIGPGGKNQYGDHFHISKSDQADFARSALDKYVSVNGKPLSSGVTVSGGEYGAPRKGRTHTGVDYAFPPGAALGLKGGAKFTSSRSGSYGDETAFQTPDGKVFKILHGKFEQAATPIELTKPAKVADAVDTLKAPTLPTAPALPVFPGAPKLVEVNDLLKVYLDLQNQTKDAAVAQNAVTATGISLKNASALAALKEQAIAPIQQFAEQTRQMQQENEVRKLRNRLAIEGVAPAIIDGEIRVLEVNRTLASVLKGVNLQTNNLVAATYKNVTGKEANIQATFELTEATLASLIAQETEISKAEILREKLQKILDLKNSLATAAQGAAGAAVTDVRAVAAETAPPGTKLSEFIATATTELKDLESVAVRVSQGIGDAVGNSLTKGIQGLVEGTTTAQQVFADFLKTIGDILMQEAAKMIATYMAIAAAKAIAGLLGGGGAIAGGSTYGGAASSSIFSAGTGTAFGGMSIPGFAEGGRPPVGRPSLVGEKGPELFVPSTAGTIIPADATAAMARYQRQGGGSGGGNSSSDAMGDGAAATPVLSMSFETTRFLGQDYVSTDQLQAAMMATEKRAAAAGAKAGAAQVTSKLQQSPAYRRQVGLR